MVKEKEVGKSYLVSTSVLGSLDELGEAEPGADDEIELAQLQLRPGHGGELDLDVRVERVDAILRAERALDGKLDSEGGGRRRRNQEEERERRW